MAEHYEIGSDKTATVRYPDAVSTGGVGPCLAVGVLDHLNGKGYLGHFYGGMEDQAFSFMDMVLGETDDLSLLEVVVVGNMPLPKEAIDYGGGDFDKHLNNYKNIRKEITNYFYNKSIDNLETYFLDNPDDSSYSITIDTGEGFIDVAKDYV